MSRHRLRQEYVKDIKNLSSQLGKSLKTELELRKIYKKHPDEELFKQIKISIKSQRKIETILNKAIIHYGSTFTFEETKDNF